MKKIANLNVQEMITQANKKWGFEKYAKITKCFGAVNVCQSREFQKTYNGFYRVRRNIEWQQIYYAMMEKYKGSAITFEELLKEFYFKTSRVEASFISKLLHTLDNNMPIWDKFVLRNLCKKIQTCHGEEKLNAAINIYEEIVAWYKAALKDERIKKKLADFDEALPQYSWFSQTKKLDFLLWQMR